MVCYNISFVEDLHSCVIMRTLNFKTANVNLIDFVLAKIKSLLLGFVKTFTMLLGLLIYYATASGLDAVRILGVNNELNVSELYADISLINNIDTSEAISYQWFADDIPITSATTNSLTKIEFSSFQMDS